MEYNGIDVSELQRKINWQSVGVRDIKFAMIRASYGTSGVDAEFVDNINNISQTNILPGAYHESSANSVSEAKQEALHFLSVIAPYKFYYPLALKIENELAMRSGKQIVTNIITEFTNTIRNAGYYPMLYAEINWLKENVILERINQLDIWLADLTSEPKAMPSYEKNVTIWQHSNRGSVPGINSKVNLDISFVDYPELIRRKAMNRLNQTENVIENNDISLENEEIEPTFYTVQPKDTLRTIAKKFLDDPERYPEIMELNGLSGTTIMPNQVLRIPNTKGNFTLYRVKPGDTLWHLAQRFLGYGPQYNEIMRLNRLTSDMIYPGQILKIPTMPQNNMPHTYIVKQGDTLWSIAKTFLGNGNKYTQIMLLNNLKNGNLRPGQVLYLPISF